MATFDVPTDLSILVLAHPLLHPTTSTSSPTTHKRTSDSSDHSETPTTTPALILADLQHYQALFSKLRFSYVEQVTKERFLRAITSDPPNVVSADANAALESVLVREKAALKERKTEVREVIASIEEQARSLVERYNLLTEQRAHLTSLPLTIASLEATIAQLQTQVEPRSQNPALNLPLDATRELLAEREAQAAELEAEITRVRDRMQERQAEVERTREEVEDLRAWKERVAEEADEAMKRRGAGGRDQLEERGRWLRGVEAGLRGMLEV
nr:kinetochore protein sos7 [Quercus suber]